MYLLVFTCNNLNRPIAFLQIEKIPLQSYLQCAILLSIPNFLYNHRYKVHDIFVFQLHIFLNVPIDIPDSRWSYLMEFHCLWYCGEITWDDFLKNGYVWFLYSRYFYFSFSWNRSHERLCIGYSLPSLATDASADRLIAPPMSSAGPFPWPAFRKFRNVKWV